MNSKKGLTKYYLLLCEGFTEYNLFAYLTKNKFNVLFSESNTKFSDKIEVSKADIIKGRLNGINCLANFRKKYNLVKQKYSKQEIFFILDKDLDDSLKIEAMIKNSKDKVQFLVYNSEYLLLKLSKKNPKEPSNFKSLLEFRNYCKDKFKKEFKKNASNFKDSDFDLIFNNLSDEEIRENFNELFLTIL